jgi:hypothetical protein
MDVLSQIISNSCQYCFGGAAAQQQQLMTAPANQGNTSGVPCCDPSAGVIANLFSNTCNVCDLAGNVLGQGGLGLTGSIPGWVFGAGALAVGLLILSRK